MRWVLVPAPKAASGGRANSETTSTSPGLSVPFGSSWKRTVHFPSALTYCGAAGGSSFFLRRMRGNAGAEPRLSRVSSLSSSALASPSSSPKRLRRRS